MVRRSDSAASKKIRAALSRRSKDIPGEIALVRPLLDDYSTTGWGLRPREPFD